MHGAPSTSGSSLQNTTSGSGTPAARAALIAAASTDTPACATRGAPIRRISSTTDPSPRRTSNAHVSRLAPPVSRASPSTVTRSSP